MTDEVTRTPAEALGPLNEIEARHAPKILHLAGDVSLLSLGPRVSIVGSREGAPKAYVGPACSRTHSPTVASSW
jgi:hypothetical protein